MGEFIRLDRLASLVIAISWNLLLWVPGTLAQAPVPAAQATTRVLITVRVAEEEPSREPLTAFVDNRPAEIQGILPARGQPLVFAILLDTSGSLIDKQSLEKNSSLELFRILAAHPNTGYFGTFDNEVYLSHKPASLDAVSKELKSIGRFRGGTALHDAVLEGAKLVNREAKGTSNRRAVFVFTDGDDKTRVSSA